MAVSRKARKTDVPDTYFMPNRGRKDECTRLAIQDRMITAAMGGPLPEFPEPASFHRVLDVACGPGGWIIDAARLYPEMHLVGVDNNPKFITYGNSQAHLEHLDQRVSFLAMDALRPLAFPDAHFDLVNMRLGYSFIRIWEWPHVLHEFFRITRPGGVVRLTENEILQETNNQPLFQMLEMYMDSLYRSGHLFSPESTGLTSHLPRLLTDHGYTQVQATCYPFQARHGEETLEPFYQNAVLLRGVRGFFEKWGCSRPDFGELYQRMLDEILRSDFYTIWPFVTVWGVKP